MSVGSLLCLLVFLTGCRDIPSHDWERVRTVRRELLRSGADRLVADDYRDFEQRYESLRQRFVRVANKSFLFRVGTQELQMALLMQLETGNALLESVERKRQELSIELGTEVSVIEGLLRSRGSQVFDRRYRHDRIKAEIRLAEARSLLEDGEVLEARSIVDELKSRSSEIRRDLEEMEGRYTNPELLRYWRRLCGRALELSEGGPVLLIDKQDRRTYLLEKGRVRKEFVADLGWNGWRDKIQEGDGATPEGEYRVVRRLGPEKTDYFRALLLNYPNGEDRRAFQKAVREGRISPKARIGGMIEIHGEGGRRENWTDGCVALTNPDMLKLFDLADVGMPVVVVGRCELE